MPELVKKHIPKHDIPIMNSWGFLEILYIPLVTGSFNGVPT